MGILAAVYSPAAFEATSRTNPLSGFDTVILTLGITAPLESCTVPTMVAVSCAGAGAARHSSKPKVARILPTTTVDRVGQPVPIRFIPDLLIVYPPADINCRPGVPVQACP